MHAKGGMKERGMHLVLHVSMPHARAKSSQLQKKWGEIVIFKIKTRRLLVKAHQSDDHRNVRRNKHVRDGRNGHATSNRRAGDVKHEESIMISQARKNIRKDSARNKGEQSVDLKRSSVTKV